MYVNRIFVIPLPQNPHLGGRIHSWGKHEYQRCLWGGAAEHNLHVVLGAKADKVCWLSVVIVGCIVHTLVQHGTIHGSDSDERDRTVLSAHLRRVQLSGTLIMFSAP